MQIFNSPFSLSTAGEGYINVLEQFFFEKARENENFREHKQWRIKGFSDRTRGMKVGQQPQFGSTSRLWNELKHFLH